MKSKNKKACVDIKYDPSSRVLNAIIKVGSMVMQKRLTGNNSRLIINFFLLNKFLLLLLLLIFLKLKVIIQNFAMK